MDAKLICPRRPDGAPDCLRCPYEDCVNDEMTYIDYRLADATEEPLHPKTAKQRRIAARNAEYYAANKDRIAARRAEYRAANKDRIAAYHAEYYAANKDRIAAYQAEYYAANKDRIAAQQRRIRELRRAAGYTQTDLAALLGVSQALISRWETGCAPADWDKLALVFPELAPEQKNAAAGGGNSDDGK